MVTTRQDSLRGNTALQRPNKFKTIAIDAVNVQNPQQKILAAISQHDVTNCVVKIIYSIKPQDLDSINESVIREKLSQTLFCSITPVVVHNPYRTNLPELDATYFKSPLNALEKYLTQRPDLNSESLLAKAKLLMSELV